jgi:membrane protein implicated in regulation of membrane protease activity
MNKKVNTMLFILGATLFNILVTVLCFVLLLILYAKLLMPLLPEGSPIWALPILFVASIIVSFIAYRFVLQLLVKRIQLDKYFEPIIGNRPPPPRD